MKQKQPKFSGILVVAVLMVLVLFIVSLSPLLAASGSKDTTYSEIYYYFENQQVTSFRLDLGTGSLELWLKEGKAALPESNAAASLPTGGLLTGVYSSDDNALPANGGTVYMTYKLPYGGDFNTGKISDFVDEYNAANPDAPMVFDYVAAKTSIPWLEIIFYVAMIGSIGMLFMSMYRGGAGGGIMNVGRAKVKDQQENQRKATFADVAGADEEKAELQEVVEFLKAPNKFNSLGARIPHGVLLVGPPGTGKTLLAKAVAGEANVPFFSISGSDFVEMFVGVGASRVRDLFKEASKVAPCIVFIDEIDTIGKSRDSGRFGGNDEREQTLNQLLAEMDGFDPTKGIILLAATNRPEVLDQALLRPGRFDRRIIVDKPNLQGRLDTLKVHTRKIRLSDDVDLRKIAQATAGAVGADLANLVNEAALRAVRKGRQLVNQEDLLVSFETVIAGTEKKNTVLTDMEKRLVAYHEVGHALVAALEKHSQPVSKITIVPHTSGALGYTMQMPEEEKYLSTAEELRTELRTLVGGRAAEQVVFGVQTTGAANDIQRATALARNMVTQYGMSEKFGLMSTASVENQYLDGQAYMDCSQETAAEVDKEVMEILQKAYADAKRILTENRGLLDEISEFLLVKETITGDELMAYVNADRNALPAAEKTEE